ncbi:coiled-coil and C2 domain-containing protein 1-like isoform X2 [Bradysia coprophila]|uniref:coiled-coil and C2 domain-containing protein 1-like isoform X2 n=1 Tax=Bradysia coprophila TaxID=38358 RepID=UPI00187DBF90|nr:coiled-coil and C2 domain-containing protein 1-like isoform X2 [Bradysia coprophila]
MSGEQSNEQGLDLTKHDRKDDGCNNVEQKPKLKPQISLVELDRMVADSLKDIEVYDDDGDDDDPALLNELSQIIEPHEVRDAVPADTTNSDGVVPRLLQQRIEMYKTAEANAISANESSRARRFGRGLSTLEAMLKDSLAGIAINEEDIPPEVIIAAKDKATTEK